MKIKAMKQKIAVKTAKLVAKIKEKTGGGKTACLLAGALAYLAANGLTGCATARLAQTPEQSSAQRAQTISATFSDCQFYFGGTNGLAGVEFLTQTQANETSGTETYAHTPTQTPSATQTPTNTTDLKADVRYNDAIAGASAASKSLLGTIGSGLDAVLSLMQSKGTGTVPVTLKDGTQTTIQCTDGQCYPCLDGACNP